MGFGGFRVKPVQTIVSDNIDPEKNLTVTLYINEDVERIMTFNEDNGYFEGKWIGPGLGTFTMKIEAEDSNNNIAEEEMQVWYFCFVPEP